MAYRERRWEFYLVFLLILGLFAIAIPKFKHALDRAREAQVVSNMHLLKAALEEFASSAGGRYPIDFSSKTSEVYPEAKRTFSVGEKIENMVNPYTKKSGIGKAVSYLSPESMIPDSFGVGMVLYIPGSPMKTEESTPWCNDYLILGYDKTGKKLSYTLKGDSLLHKP